MSEKRFSSKKAVWRGTCVICKSLLDFFYTAFVFFIIIIVSVVAYIATLDEVPMPQFLLRELESQLERRGASIKVKGMRFHPNGSIFIEQATLSSNELKSPIATADRALVKIDLPLLIFGRTSIDSIRVSNGSIIAPPIISPSGTANTVVHGIDFAVTNDTYSWNIDYARLEMGQNRFFVSGPLSKKLIRPKEAKRRQPINIKELTLKWLPRLAEWQNKYSFHQQLATSIRIHPAPHSSNTFEIKSLINEIDSGKGLQSDTAIVSGTLDLKGPSSLRVVAKNLSGPAKTQASRVESFVHWSHPITAARHYPDTYEIFAYDIGTTEALIPQLLASGGIEAGKTLHADAAIELSDQAVAIQTTIDLNELSGQAQLQGIIGADLPRLAAIAAQRDLASLAELEQLPELEAQVVFGPKFKLDTATAKLSVGRLVASGASFDRAFGSVYFDGSQISVENLFASTGPKSGIFDIYYNLDTKRRRFLIEGQFDPNGISAWFGPWWENFWNNFQFPEDGMYCLIDSQAIHLQPRTIHVTGLAQGKDVGIRGHPMEEIRTKLKILFHYFDLYEAEITRHEGKASGAVQIAIDKDPRDNKEKMVGLWVDATSGIDAMIGPDVLYETRTQVANILAPYSYELPPTVRSVSKSTRHLDKYDYAIDLNIATENDIAFFGFPFESLDVDVQVDNSKILIRNGQAGIAGGLLQASADIINDDIDLTVSLNDANFGGTLKAADDYFEANETEETANEENNVDPETLRNYDGIVAVNFEGSGKIGDTLSYTGQGNYNIEKANLSQIRLFGLLSKALEATPFRFSTLKFTKADGTFTANKRYLEFPDAKISGPIALIKTDGKYDLEREALDFKAKLFPFRRAPIIAIMGVVLDPLSKVLEMNVTGSLGDPKLSLFTPEAKQPETATESTEKPELPASE